ncbi:MAG TPA: DUF4369 domain-containing protein, partial [Lacibacter sp.]|nr:DUF4369 domain-containing protein [Lacibacter sp.]
MKFLLQLCVLVMALPALAQEQQFVLKGSLPPSSKKWTVLLYWNEGASAEEAKLVNGKFEIKGTIEEPVKATLVLQEVNPPRDKKFDFNEMQANRLELFLEGGNITVTSTGRLAYAVVQGPPAVQDYYNFQQQARHLQPLEAGMMSMMNHYTRQKRTDVLARNFEKLLDAYIGFYFEEQQVFMRKQPASPVSFYFVKQAVQSGLDPAKATTLFGLLSPGL